MKLSDLAFACYIYSHMSDDYDSSYRQLLKATGPQINLQLEQHQKLLLKWLNDWGCRQFAKEYHPLAAQEIAEWYKEISLQLFSINTELLSLTDDNFALIESVYAKLVGRTASMRKSSKGSEFPVKVGPTGTAKILFALRPNALIPWDNPIRDKFNFDGSSHSYCAYLRIVKGHLEELSHDCIKFGFSVADLPSILDRPVSSVAKLMDEYFWVTISRKCPTPDDNKFMSWIAWR
jgi:hypothetical protein